MTKNDNVSPTVRRSYQRPELSQHGAMRDITKGGTAGTPEAVAGRNPNRRS
jgi:hypothetical protein